MGSERKHSEERNDADCRKRHSIVIISEPSLLRQNESAALIHRVVGLRKEVKSFRKFDANMCIRIVHWICNRSMRNHPLALIQMTSTASVVRIVVSDLYRTAIIGINALLI